MDSSLDSIVDIQNIFVFYSYGRGELRITYGLREIGISEMSQFKENET